MAKHVETSKLVNESLERYNLALSASRIGIWDWDIEADEIFLSPLLSKMLAIQESTFKPSIAQFKELIYDEDRDDVVAILEAHLTRGFDFNVECRVYRSNRSYVWMHVRGQAIWDKDGNPTRMTGSFYDIMDRRQAIDSLTSSNESLEKFAYICSHDLKEPARLIQNFSELIIVSYADKLDDKGKRYIESISESSIHMQSMIQGVLNYSQIEAKDLQLEHVNVEEEIQKALDNLKLTIEERNAEITMSNIPFVDGDRTALFQLFYNLIGNALKFCKEKTPRIHIEAIETDNEYQFSIKDNGIGMKKEHLSKIFDAFQRLNSKDDYAGSGIGLSLCKSIVHKHAGSIWVDSELGEGSTFYFVLPKNKRRKVANL